MRSNVTFRCKRPVNLEKHPPGEELANWIAEKITAAGLLTRVIDLYGDFAWLIESESDQRMPWVLLGYVGDGPAEWLIQINSNVGWVGRLLGRSDKMGRDLFTMRLHSVLSSVEDFAEVRWHFGDWSEVGWSSNPDTPPSHRD